MSRSAVREVLPADPREHPAARALRRLQPGGFEPEGMEILKVKKRKSAVYRLTGAGPGGAVIIAKRCVAETARVERTVYEKFLPRVPLPTLRCRGSVPDTDVEFCWLFMEDASEEVYSPSIPEHRALAGRWLGTLHRASHCSDLRSILPNRDTAHYLALLRSTRHALLRPFSAPLPIGSDENVELLRALLEACDSIEDHWDELERFCQGWPPTLVHGDFVIKNLRVRHDTRGLALLVFDWEMAGWGVPATDLAQFIGRCASPDLEVYASLMKDEAPSIDRHEARRMAEYGNLLRVLDKIYWSTLYWATPSPPGMTRWFVLKPLVTLRKYETQMQEALRALEWCPYD